MAAIRQDLGVCPQFDILWPEITVKEHLMLYAAIKGFNREQQLQEATHAAHDVGRLTCLTNLSLKSLPICMSPCAMACCTLPQASQHQHCLGFKHSWGVCLIACLPDSVI